MQLSQRVKPVRRPPVTLLLQSSTMFLISTIDFFTRPLLFLIVAEILSENLDVVYHQDMNLVGQFGEEFPTR